MCVFQRTNRYIIVHCACTTHIMPSHGTKHKCTSSDISKTQVLLSIAQSGQSAQHIQSPSAYKWSLLNHPCFTGSPVMLSNSLSSSSSNDKSFGEDDMYGSDSNIGTISLRPSFHASSTGTHSPLVHVFPLSNMLSF